MILHRPVRLVVSWLPSRRAITWLCARHALCWPAFPLGSALGSQFAARSKQRLLLDYFVNQASSRAASYHTVSMKALLCITAKLRADVADGSGASNWCRSQHFRFTPTSRRNGADIVEPPVSARSCRDQKQMTWRLRAYSITSSARTKIDGGTVRPSALAVLAFTTISNFTGT